MVKSALSKITYKEILDNPIDLELNLNYAKQQEKAGNIKSTMFFNKLPFFLVARKIGIRLM